MPSKMPRFVPTQMMVRRSLFATANAGYVSSGGGSSEGAFMTAGVESRIVPNGCARTTLMTLVASATAVAPVRFINGASVAALATVNAIIVPSAVVVYRLRSAVASEAQGPE